MANLALHGNQGLSLFLDISSLKTVYQNALKIRSHCAWFLWANPKTMLATAHNPKIGKTVDHVTFPQL